MSSCVRKGVLEYGTPMRAMLSKRRSTDALRYTPDGRHSPHTRGVGWATGVGQSAVAGGVEVAEGEEAGAHGVIVAGAGRATPCPDIC